jgi:hypothetical protein
MFKLLIALSLFAAIQCQLLGGFTDRPDLIKSPVTQSMVKLAVNQYAETENIRLFPVSVLHVSTQDVNGVNYRIVFTARPTSSANIFVCTTEIYQPITGDRSVSSIQCA